VVGEARDSLHPQLDPPLRARAGATAPAEQWRWWLQRERGEAMSFVEQRRRRKRAGTAQGEDGRQRLGRRAGSRSGIGRKAREETYQIRTIVRAVSKQGLNRASRRNV